MFLFWGGGEMVKKEKRGEKSSFLRNCTMNTQDSSHSDNTMKLLISHFPLHPDWDRLPCFQCGQKKAGQVAWSAGPSERGHGGNLWAAEVGEWEEWSQKQSRVQKQKRRKSVVMINFASFRSLPGTGDHQRKFQVPFCFFVLWVPIHNELQNH